MIPDASQYDPRPEYISDLIESTGMVQSALGVKLGVNERTIRKWKHGERTAPYLAQFALECLVLQV